MTLFRCFAFLVLACISLPALGSEKLKVFILAGQSNMEGQAVVDLTGKDYNEGRGTLVEVMKSAENKERMAHLRQADGKWTVREDVSVHYQRENQPLLFGKLGVGYAVYGGKHHFGPELQFGHVLGDASEGPVLLIKTAWGGKSLAKDFRPPSSGPEVGPYYTKMISQVHDVLNNLDKLMPEESKSGYELAGFVWYHGWNDGAEGKQAIDEYESNLVHLIQDVRREFNSPDLPIIVGEITGPWKEAPAEWTRLRDAQKSATLNGDLGPHVLFVPTRDFVRAAEDSPNPTHGHHEFGNAETYFLVGDALGKGMLKLLNVAK